MDTKENESDLSPSSGDPGGAVESSHSAPEGKPPGQTAAPGTQAPATTALASPSRVQNTYPGNVPSEIRDFWQEHEGRIRDLEDRLKTFQVPGATDHWRELCLSYARRLDEIKAQTESYKNEKRVREDEIARYQASMEKKKAELKGVKEKLQAATEKFEKAEAKWQENIRTRRIQHLAGDPDGHRGHTLPEDGEPQREAEKLLDELYDQAASDARQDYLTKIEEYVDIQGVKAYLENEQTAASSSQIARARIVFKHWDRNQDLVRVGLAVEVLFSLPSEHLVDFTASTRELIRLNADIDEKTGTVEYKSLIYKSLKVRDYGDTYDDVVKRIRELNSQSYLGRSNWRLPTREELERLRYVGRSGRDAHIYTPFPELCIEREKPYWTQEEAEPGFERRFWTVSFGKRRFWEVKSVTAACFALIVSDGRSNYQ